MYVCLFFFITIAANWSLVGLSGAEAAAAGCATCVSFFSAGGGGTWIPCDSFHVLKKAGPVPSFNPVFFLIEIWKKYYYEIVFLFPKNRIIKIKNCNKNKKQKKYFC